MKELIIQCSNSISEFLCDDIIEKYNENTSDTKINIQKNSKGWNKIELLIYKQLLINIKKYKNYICNNNTFESNRIYSLLTQDLYMEFFTILKIDPATCNNDKYCEYPKNYNRKNLLNFVFYLNTINDGGNLVYNDFFLNPEKGKLVIYPYNQNFKYKYPVNESQYLIIGQIYFYH